MFCKEKGEERVLVGKETSLLREAPPLPNLVGVQLESYEKFLQIRALQEGQPLESQGLEEVFRLAFPFKSTSGEISLEYDHYYLDFEGLRYSIEDCKRKGLTYSVPVKAQVNLVFHNTGEIRQKDVYMGDIPLMTEGGTFIINGAERVVVTQIHRSPGIIFFSEEQGVYGARIIPYRGAWLEFEIDPQREIVYAKIDRKKRVLGTLFLRALGLDTREKIVEQFYKRKTLKIPSSPGRGDEALMGRVLACDVRDKSGEKKKILSAGMKLRSQDVEDLRQEGIKSVKVIDFDDPQSLRSSVILNCFEREDVRVNPDGEVSDEPVKEEVLAQVYSILMPGEPVNFESANRDLKTMFFSPRRYDLGKVGRYKLNRRFQFDDEEVDSRVLTVEDIVCTMGHLARVYDGEISVDDIDHLGNRRVRSVGESLTNVLKSAFSKMERIAQERMALRESESLKPQDLLSVKPVVAAVKEFFGSSQLSQFMDQVNPLAGLTHKRRLSALGPGGLSRDRAGFEVRDVHYSHYGRMCPIETPEGPNIGLIVSLANYARVSDHGFLETPYFKVEGGRVLNEVTYLSAGSEDACYIAQASARVGDDGHFLDKGVAVRRAGDYTIKSPQEISYIDVSPRQIISTSASLIPFLEHDDANRALMGCNMQRQAVPLLFPEVPLVGTGMEGRAAFDSGVLLKARRAGVVESVTSNRIEVKTPEGEIDFYPLVKYQRTNQDTCFTQSPIVKKGESINQDDVLADGLATRNGELALGRNLLVGFVPWNGCNYEDAILISEKVVREDYYTSIHIREFVTEIRETKLGPEKLTPDIPNMGEKSLVNLDEEGIIRVGSRVRSQDILVGKITPKAEVETTPEFRLLSSIFGEKAKEVRDSSLKLPHGVEGTVIDIQRLKRNEGDDLSPGVDEVVKVLVASKRKLKEGDKMAGRHGNKGVVARVLPEEDMPYLADGTALEVCLNPLGIPSRMNIGQLMESALGFAGAKLGKHYEVPVFGSITTEGIQEELKKAGCPPTSKAVVYDGLTGDQFDGEVFIGYMYCMKLHHLVDDKMHARSTGPYSLITQQPLGGKAQFGGQRLGEMEVWALEAYGAANTLRELMTIKSDDMKGRAKIYEGIVKGSPTFDAGVPESFNVLVQELRGLALDVRTYDAKGNQVAMTERDEELLERQKAQF